ncbi:unnamed protein product [Amoebophrya sp. A25]|nr:unnamed protein product [Amoebophrya sp. A25]|eukprot:GSA25T00001585001.1
MPRYHSRAISLPLKYHVSANLSTLIPLLRNRRYHLKSKFLSDLIFLLFLKSCNIFIEVWKKSLQTTKSESVDLREQSDAWPVLMAATTELERSTRARALARWKVIWKSILPKSNESGALFLTRNERLTSTSCLRMLRTRVSAALLYFIPFTLKMKEQTQLKFLISLHSDVPEHKSVLRRSESS